MKEHFIRDNIELIQEKWSITDDELAILIGVPNHKIEYHDPDESTTKILLKLEKLTGVNYQRIVNSKLLPEELGDSYRDIKISETEKILQSIVDEFLEDRIDFKNIQDSSDAFNFDMKEKLNQLYEVNSKIIFLDYIHDNIRVLLYLHDYFCLNGENCFGHKKLKRVNFYVRQEVNSLPRIIDQNKVSQAKVKNKVFICYSQIDREWLEQLRRHFRTFESEIEFWDDSKITPGQEWRSEIRIAIKEAKIAVLLISADFFNSEFILNNELPPLLEKAKSEGTTILNVILKPCLFKENENISKYQAINNPKKTIIEMDEASREIIWTQIVRQVHSILTDK